MLIEKFFKDYIHSPFLYWGIIVGILSIFDASIISIRFFEFYFLNQLNIVILFLTLGVALSISCYPIRKGLKKYSREHAVKYRVLIGLQIFLVFIVQAAYSLIENFVLFGTIWPVTIVNQNEFDFNKNFVMLAQFAFLPIIYFHIFNTIKSMLAKEGYQTDDKLRNNLGFIFSNIGIFIGGIIVFGLINWTVSS